MSETIIHEATGTVLARRISWARSPIDRARGLIGKPRMGLGDALVIERAPQVHTIGMSYAIDVVFCDAGWQVRYYALSLPPWRVTRWVRGARYAIEMPGGSIQAGIEIGDRLVVVAQSSER